MKRAPGTPISSAAIWPMTSPPLGHDRWIRSALTVPSSFTRGKTHVGMPICMELAAPFLCPGFLPPPSPSPSSRVLLLRESSLEGSPPSPGRSDSRRPIPTVLQSKLHRIHSQSLSNDPCRTQQQIHLRSPKPLTPPVFGFSVNAIAVSLPRS